MLLGAWVGILVGEPIAAWYLSLFGLGIEMYTMNESEGAAWLTSIVGVDFGGGMLRAVELSDADKSRPTIERYNEMPLPEGAVVRGEVVEPNTVATALKRLWSTGGFTSKSIAIGSRQPQGTRP